MKIAPITTKTYVLACTEPPCVRYLKQSKGGHFASVTSITQADHFESEEQARDFFARYAVQPRGTFSGGSTWDVFEVTTKITTAPVKVGERHSGAVAEAERRPTG